MLRSYLKIWDWDLISGRALKAIFSPGVCSPWSITYVHEVKSPRASTAGTTLNVGGQTVATKVSIVPGLLQFSSPGTFGLL